MDRPEEITLEDIKTLKYLLEYVSNNDTHGLYDYHRIDSLKRVINRVGGEPVCDFKKCY